MKNVPHTDKVVSDFQVSFLYEQADDKLQFISSRDLKHIDILLMLTQLLSMIDEEHRDTIIELAKNTILLKKYEKLQ